MNMLKRLLNLCLLIICLACSARSQNSAITSLQKQIALAPNDTNKVIQYVNLFDLYSANNVFDSCLMICRRAGELSLRLGYVHGMVLSTIRHGVAYEVLKKDYPAAINYYRQAIEIAEAKKSYRDIFQANSCILNMYYYTGNYPDAMRVVQKGLIIAESQKDNWRFANYKDQLGFIYLKQEKPVEAIKYYRQYLSLAMTLHDQMMVADAYNCIADVFALQRDFNSSLENSLKALKIYQAITGKLKYDHYAGKAYSISFTQYKISSIYKQLGKYQQALNYALAGLKYTDGRGILSFNNYDLASYYINLGEIYSALRDYHNAVIYLAKGLSLSKAILHREDILAAYKSLSKTYALQNKYDSAFHYQGLYGTLRDSLINEKATRAVEQIRNSFENDRKDKEIALLNQQQKLKETEAEKKGLLLNIVIIFFSLLAVISYLVFYIRNNQKQQKLALEKQLAVQNERQRISGDMHDDIGTGLSTMLLYVNMLKNKLSGTNEYTDVERLSTLGDELVSQMKEIVWSLNPVNDSLENLLIFIRQYFSQLFEPLPYQTTLVFPAAIPDVSLKGVARRNIYLCVKEALNNIIKHAAATAVNLTITLEPNKLIILIKDNGTGFPDDLTNKFYSNGLKSMQHRIEQIGGEFKYFNNNGAIVSITLVL